jgi:hypothetical protein
MSDESKTKYLDALLFTNWLTWQVRDVHAAVDKDIAALEAKHAAEIARLNDEYTRLVNTYTAEEVKMRAEIDALKSKMAGMVCGTCKGDGYDPATGWDWVNNQYITLTPCMVCQPKKEG